MLTWSVPLKRGSQTHVFYGCAAGPVDYKVYSFGGFFYDGKTYNNKDQIDVHVFNTVTLCWVTLPPVTTGRAIVRQKTFDDNNWFVITGDYDNILYAFDVDTHRWFKPKVSGAVPEERSNHSASVLEKVIGKELVRSFLSGGQTLLTMESWMAAQLLNDQVETL